MKGKIPLMLTALLLMSCSKDEIRSVRDLDYEYGKNLTHDKIVLGDQLENPYTTENMTKALESLYPTKADRVELKTTNLYVRFLPKTEAEFDLLKESVPHLMDHPLDYEIEVEGDWYHDDQLDEESITWQYAVVENDFKFPDNIYYEILDECYISENDPATRSDGIDWASVEREAYRLTGNENMLLPVTKADSPPQGRITIVDENYIQGKPIGVSGVRVSCNSFVKFDRAYTDRDGYYKMSRNFSSDIRYRLVFTNEKGFSIGFNFILVPASVSTLGKSAPTGVTMTITKESDDKLFRRCAVNNAAYDYYTRCAAEDMNITSPPTDLRIWIFNFLKASSAVMMHHGAITESSLVSEYLGVGSSILKFFSPDITIGTDDITYDYARIYSTTCHELAHASHFAEVDAEYWDKYIRYILTSYIESGGLTYGSGSGEYAGYCEIGEMWGYYMESKMYKDRYGGKFPTFGTSYWFYPQIFRSLDEKGLSTADIFSVLTPEVNSRDILKTRFLSSFPQSNSVIQQVFSKY